MGYSTDTNRSAPHCHLQSKLRDYESQRHYQHQLKYEIIDTVESL